MLNISIDKKLHDLQMPEYFAKSKIKRDLYSIDTYFRETFENIEDLKKEGIIFDFKNLAGLVFKPESVVGRKILLALDYLKSYGFVPVAYDVFRYDRHIIRNAWRYQFNIASKERIAIVDILEEATDSIFIIFKDIKCEKDVPASVRLSSLKGPSVPEHRLPNHLRYVLGMNCILLNYIHTTDEIADFIRELGVYFPSVNRQKLLSDASKGIDKTDFIVNQVQQMYDKFPEHDLSLDNSYNRVLEKVKNQSQPIIYKEVCKWVEKMKAKDENDWMRFFEFLNKHNIEVDLWDKIVIGTNLTDVNVEGLETIL